MSNAKAKPKALKPHLPPLDPAKLAVGLLSLLAAVGLGYTAYAAGVPLFAAPDVAQVVPTPAPSLPTLLLRGSASAAAPSAAPVGVGKPNPFAP